jgi:hypothetical protein
MEPLTFLTKWFIRSSRSARDPRTWPPLCNLVNLQESPIIVVRQAWSSACSGDYSRLALVYLPALCEDYCTFAFWL